MGENKDMEINLAAENELAIEFPEAYDDFLELCEESGLDVDTESFAEYLTGTADDYAAERAREQAEDRYFDR